MHSSSNLALSLLLSGTLSLAAGCDDPADDVAAATVSATQTETAPSTEAPAASPLQTLTIDGTRSSIGFIGSKVTGSHEGGFREFTGTIAFDPADPTRSQIEATIQTASLFTDNEERLTPHLKGADFFDVEGIPTATFRSTSIEAGGEGTATHTITGALNLHGQERTIRFPATVTVTDAEVAATAEFSINRTEFGMNYPGMEDDLIRERVVIKLDLHASR